jgi:tRNA-uridine 2-sulfurtransferase
MVKTIHPTGKKVALGMSGGVDSSLCAHLLVEQGYDVTGVFLECWRAPGCRSEADRADALKVALALNIPFEVLDFKQAYHDTVVEYFFSEYQAGRTPNPDVMCNKEIKFGLFYNWAIQNGFDFVATGHYAKIITKNKRPFLAIPNDHHKDQTYFLYLTTEDQLRHTLFPLQDLTKTQVRAEADKRNLHVAYKKDSVGICFIGDINVHNFLKERLGENPGEVVDTHGNVIGSHKGLWFYTVGQRGGFSINQTSVVKNSEGIEITKHNIPPFYVIAKKPTENQLVVGFGNETLRQSFNVNTIQWISEEPSASEKTALSIRIRHTGELIPGALHADNTVTLSRAVKGIAEGQSAVFYIHTDQQILCLGGGIIG